MGAEVVGFVALDVDEAEGVGFTTLLALVCLVVATFLDGGFLRLLLALVQQCINSEATYSSMPVSSSSRPRFRRVVWVFGLDLSFSKLESAYFGTACVD